MNYLGKDLGGCSVSMDELEAVWLQVSEVGEAGCHQEESVLSNATTETKQQLFSDFVYFHRAHLFLKFRYEIKYKHIIKIYGIKPH
jgi:hypothetical protein